MATQWQAELAIVDDASAADITRLEDRLDAFNAAATGIFDARFLTILVKHPDGELRAGLHGHTWGESCEIKLLWVAEQDRGCGLGIALIEAAEGEARRRGCRQIVLSTHSFQAPGFYARRGFARVATVPDHPVGHAHILMVKRLID